MVVDAPFHAADNLYLVNAFAAHAQVVFEEVRVHDGTGDAHAHGADGEVALSAHGCGCHGALGKAQDLFLHIGRNYLIIGILYVVSVDAEGGKALLGVCGQHGGQVHGAGTLRSVEAPHGLDGVRVHVHGFGAVAPAGGYRDGDGHALARELLCAGGGFCHAAYGAVGNDALYGCTIGIFEFLADEFRYCHGHAHGLVFQGFTDTVHASVDGGTDANFGMGSNHISGWLLVIVFCDLKVRKNFSGCQEFLLCLKDAVSLEGRGKLSRTRKAAFWCTNDMIQASRTRKVPFWCTGVKTNSTIYSCASCSS